MNYSHGGDIEAFASHVGCSIDEVIDLSSNINFVYPEINIDLNTALLNSYPKYDNLYEAISTHFEVNSNQLELYNGGSSAIFALMNYFKHQNCYIYSPAYLEYKKAAIVANKSVKLINRFVELEKDIEDNSLVIFVNPSTPDGILYDMKTLIEFWKNKNATVIVDESFLEFTTATSLSQYLTKYSNLYILKSMTKFHGTAGVRIGCVVSNEQNIKQLRANEPLWKISQLDSIYIQEVLKDKHFTNISLNVNANAKTYLEKILKEFDIFDDAISSNANFILVRLKGMSAKEFQAKLYPYKIMVRDCSNFDFLDDKYIRVAVKSEENMKSFRKAVESIVS